MPNTKQDRGKVAGGQDHEVKYEAGKTGSTKSEVKEAVKSRQQPQAGRRQTRQEVTTRAVSGDVRTFHQ